MGPAAGTEKDPFGKESLLWRGGRDSNIIPRAAPSAKRGGTMGPAAGTEKDPFGKESLLWRGGRVVFQV
jgi:hypothetical protein